jgi:antitoxin YefM
MATIVAMETLPLGDARDRFSALVTSVEQTHDRVTVTRNGVPAAVIVSPADLEELEETIAVLSSSVLIRQLAESREDVQRGDLLDATEDRESLIASIKSRAGR